jgi:hypothetical protein
LRREMVMRRTDLLFAGPARWNLRKKRKRKFQKSQKSSFRSPRSRSQLSQNLSSLNKHFSEKARSSSESINYHHNLSCLQFLTRLPLTGEIEDPNAKGHKMYADKPLATRSEDDVDRRQEIQAAAMLLLSKRRLIKRGCRCLCRWR